MSPKGVVISTVPDITRTLVVDPEFQSFVIDIADEMRPSDGASVACREPTPKGRRRPCQVAAAIVSQKGTRVALHRREIRWQVVYPHEVA